MPLGRWIRHYLAAGLEKSSRQMVPAAHWYKKLAAVRYVFPHVRELAFIGGAYFLYMFTRSLVFSDFEATALENARKIISFEQSIGLFLEPDWQAWAIASTKALVVFFNWAYIVTFWPIILTTAVILYFTNRHRYMYYRNVVLLSFGLAILGFMLFPLAPPRMIAEYFVDTIKDFGPTAYASREFASFYNPYAAMPSLHFSWTLMFGILFLRSHSKLLKVLGVIYPTMTLFAITITGNHYIMDAVGGAALIIGAFAILEFGVRRKLYLPRIIDRINRRVSPLESSQTRPEMPVGAKSMTKALSWGIHMEGSHAHSPESIETTT